MTKKKKKKWGIEQKFVKQIRFHILSMETFLVDRIQF